MLHERKSRLREGRAALSSSEPELTPPRGRSGRVGAELRAARVQYGWDLEAVAASLRIRATYLQALEAGRLADLPGNAYALGFLRTYATALGLDADEMSRRFRAEVAEVNAKTELTFPAPVPERGVPAGAVILLGVVLAIGAYVGWYRLTEHGAPVAQVPPVPPKLAHLAEPTVLAPKPIPAPAGQSAAPALPAAVPHVSFAANPVVAPPAGGQGAPAGVAQATTPAPTAPVAITPASTTPAPATPLLGAHPATLLRSAAAQAGSAVEAAAGGPENPSTASAGPTTARGSASSSAPGGAASGGSSSGATPASQLSAVAALAPPAQAAPAQAANGPPEPAGTIIVRAVAESWIEVRDATGAIIFTKLMQPGETWTAPQEPGLTLTTGNAGGTELVVDGKVAASLGTAGEVERNQPLDPGLIKSGALPAQIAAAAAPQGTHSNLTLEQ